MSAVGAGLRKEDSPDLKRRGLVFALVLLAIVAVAVLLFRGDGGYTVTAEFINAGQLVKGNEVKAGGVTVGSVKSIDVTEDGHAKVELGISDGDYKPLRRGTQVMIKQASLSGIANRYVDLKLGPANGEAIDDGGVIGPDQTATAVELDQIFDLFNQQTRTGLQDFFKGSGEMLRGRGKELRNGVHYLNPALSTGARLFHELTRDDALLERFLVDSGTLVNALGQRREDLTGMARNLDATFGALGRGIGELPDFMRRANTTFVNLRSALNDVDPFVDAAKPAVRRLGPFLDQARLFVRDGEPTIRDLSKTITRPGPRNDLIELVRSFPPLAHAAVDSQRVNGAQRRGAFPETADALNKAAPTIAFGRPYTPDFVGWMDDFSTTGGYDALGGFSRAWINLSELLYGPGPKLHQYRRCPGANEEPARDGSNTISGDQAETLDCDPSQRSVGP
jgi:phospholipid/cholesterol/gamma-HCH transport system substrate-binding protein